MTEKFYTVRQVIAEILPGVHPAVLSNMCLQGKIPGAVKFGKSWRIPESAIKAILHIAK